LRHTFPKLILAVSISRVNYLLLPNSEALEAITSFHHVRNLCTTYRVGLLLSRHYFYCCLYIVHTVAFISCVSFKKVDDDDDDDEQHVIHC